jgi:hypothetical protein
MGRSSRISVIVASMFISAARVDAIPVGIETFDAPHDWVYGAGPVLGPTPTPVPVQLGGQAGAADPFLLLQATGGTGPGSRLSAQNLGDWAGDYASAGITQIVADANNFGPSDLSLRVLLMQLGPMGPVHAALTSAVSLAAATGWQNVAFDISPAGLIATPGSDVHALLQNVHEVRFFHNPDPFFIPGQNPAVLATLGLDNLQAVGGAAVPEPSALALLAAAWALRGVRRRRA